VFTRFGLRSRMAVSYVLVSAAAVLVVEAVLLAVVVLRWRSANDDVHQAQQQVEQARQQADQAEAAAAQGKVQSLALELSVAAAEAASRSVRQGDSDQTLLAKAATKSFRPPEPQKGPATAAGSVQVLATVDGRVVVSSPEDAVVGDSLLPSTAIGASARTGRTTVNGQPAVWASRPVEMTDGSNSRTIGIAYIRLPGRDSKQPRQDAAAAATGTADGDTGIGTLVFRGGLALILLLPLGVLFGLLSTGQLIRRIRGLAAGASAMAGGDLKARVPVSGGDEVGRLEQAFNTMAERLDAAVGAERKAAGSEARLAERTRIARELHDSISQDLFSASMLAGGLRKALLPSSQLRRQAESLELSLVYIMREMRAMLLELRPIALEDVGLAEALDELCRAYQERLGISISSRIDAPGLDAPVEHAVLRVIQEALGNAVRHGEPATIELSVARSDGRIAVTVQDDGRGFDPGESAGRHGMGLQLMRDRVGELGGTFEVLSAPQRGTTVKVLLPAGAE
jgi:two-component system, NarL family, sensor histidine kinase LiaS